MENNTDSEKPEPQSEKTEETQNALLPCPFCGKHGTFWSKDQKAFIHGVMGCPLEYVEFTVEDWNKRAAQSGETLGKPEANVSAADAPKQKDGIALIAAERQRQISVEGWTSQHDDTHTQCELVRAAISYALPGVRKRTPPPMQWPWSDNWWKPSSFRIENLAKSGALIAAEIDRLFREAPSVSRTAPTLDVAGVSAKDSSPPAPVAAQVSEEEEDRKLALLTACNEIEDLERASYLDFDGGEQHEKTELSNLLGAKILAAITERVEGCRPW